jgi:hypothetical protein
MSPSPPAFAKATAGAQRGGERALSICGVNLLLDLSGALYWPEERTLVVADLQRATRRGW